MIPAVLFDLDDTLRIESLAELPGLLGTSSAGRAEPPWLGWIGWGLPGLLYDAKPCLVRIRVLR